MCVPYGLARCCPPLVQGSDNECVCAGASSLSLRSVCVSAVCRDWTSVQSGTVRLRDTLLLRNSASFGGMLYNALGGRFTASNCSVQYNTATADGGVLFSFDATSTFNSSTVTHNSASARGGVASVSEVTTALLVFVAISGTAINTHLCTLLAVGVIRRAW